MTAAISLAHEYVKGKDDSGFTADTMMPVEREGVFGKGVDESQ